MTRLPSPNLGSCLDLWWTFQSRSFRLGSSQCRRRGLCHGSYCTQEPFVRCDYRVRGPRTPTRRDIVRDPGRVSGYLSGGLPLARRVYNFGGSVTPRTRTPTCHQKGTLKSPTRIETRVRVSRSDTNVPGQDRPLDGPGTETFGSTLKEGRENDGGVVLSLGSPGRGPRDQRTGEDPFLVGTTTPFIGSGLWRGFYFSDPQDLLGFYFPGLVTLQPVPTGPLHGPVTTWSVTVRVVPR